MSTQTATEGSVRPFSGYAEPEERPPLTSYATLTAVFNLLFAGAVAGAQRSGRKLPDRVAPSDVVLTGVASHKLSRLLAKDKVTAWLRAPFTRYQQPGGPSELEESPRGSGARRAIGELIVCPYCLGMWTSAGLHVGLLYAPRVTRLISSTFTALTISDFLQIAYKAAEERGLGGE